MPKRPLTRTEQIVLRIIAVCVIAMVAVGGAIDRRIDVNRPRQPDPSSGRIYPEFVNHGHLRYVTRVEKAAMDCSTVAFISLTFVFVIIGLTIVVRRKSASSANEA